MIRQGVTLYSMTNEWVTGRYDLPGILEQVSARGLGPGVEIVGFQSIKGFPDVSPEFVGAWHDLVERYSLVPTCLGSNIDVAQRSDRLLSDEEMTESLLRQMRTARELGFGVVRIQIGARPAVIERVTPQAEEWGLRLGMELHAPEGAATARILEVREVYDRIGSDYLGFIPDFSATMRAIPLGIVEDLLGHGLPDEWARRLQAEWAGDGLPFDRFGRFARSAVEAGVPQEVVDASMMVFTMNGREAVESWLEIGHQIFHVHGKCYQFDSAGDEPSIDYPALVRLLIDIGFDGYMSTEWEGHIFLGPDDADAFEMVAAQQALVRREIAALR